MKQYELRCVYDDMSCEYDGVDFKNASRTIPFEARNDREAVGVAREILDREFKSSKTGSRYYTFIEATLFPAPVPPKPIAKFTHDLGKPAQPAASAVPARRAVLAIPPHFRAEKL